MNTPQRDADAIKAWADGNPIQFRNRALAGAWMDYKYPKALPAFSSETLEWRPKPEPVVTVKFGRVTEENVLGLHTAQHSADNLRLVYTNGVLTGAEVV